MKPLRISSSLERPLIMGKADQVNLRLENHTIVWFGNTKTCVSVIENSLEMVFSANVESILISEKFN
jgi:hypothetical protein